MNIAAKKKSYGSFSFLSISRKITDESNTKHTQNQMLNYLSSNEDGQTYVSVSIYIYILFRPVLTKRKVFPP